MVEDLPQLLELRDEMLENQEDTAAIEQELQRYFEALPKKVDAVAHVYKHYASLEIAAAEEERRLKARKHFFRRLRERLEGYVTSVLETMPKPKTGSTRRLEGRVASLALVQNGGLAGLKIENEQLVPNECCSFIVEFDYKGWLEAKELLNTPAVKNAQRVIENKLLRQALEAACPRCLDRAGQVESCELCGGSGANPVGGARLERGFHVKVT